MNDHHMSAFVTVIDCGSISKAARLLFITPQALSQQMDLLERECGAKLLERGSQGVSLTAAGELFYGFAEESLSRQKDLLGRIQKLKTSQEQTIRIGATIGPPSNMAMSVRHEFFQTHPQYRQEIIETNIMDRLDAVASDRIDVVEYAESCSVEERGLCFRKLAEGQLVLMTSADNPLAGRKGLSLDDLGAQKIQVFDWDFYRNVISRHPAAHFVQYHHTAPGFSESFHADILEHCQNGEAFLAVKGSEIYNSQLNLFRIELILLNESIDLGLVFKKEASDAARDFIDYTLAAQKQRQNEESR